MSNFKNYILSALLIALKLWVGLKFLFEGFEKFENLDHLAGKSSPFLDFYLAMDSTGYMLPLIGVIEILGGLLVISQRYSFAGAVILLPVALNVLLAHTFLIQNPRGITLTSILFAILLLIFFMEKKRISILMKANPILFKNKTPL